MPKFTNVIGIDMAYRKPVCLANLIASDGKLVGLREVKPHNDIYSLACEIEEKLAEWVPSRSPKILVVCETPLLINNRNTAYTLTRIHSMIEYIVRARLGCHFFGIHPNTWQKSLLGRAEDKKKASIAHAQDLIGVEELNDDEADAINLAYFCIKRMDDIERALKGEGKFSEKVRKPE